MTELEKLLADRLEVKEAIRYTGMTKRQIETLRSISVKSKAVLYIPVEDPLGERLDRFYLNITIYKVKRDTDGCSTMAWFNVDPGQEKKLALLDAKVKLAEANDKVFDQFGLFPSSSLTTRFVRRIVSKKKDVYFATRPEDFNPEKDVWFFRYTLTIFSKEDIDKWAELHHLSHLSHYV
jgi:hypothetical protein